MKNCIKFVVFLSEVIHPYGRAILVPYKKCLFQFPFFAVCIWFFSGDIFELFLKPFSMSEFAGFKNIYIYVYI